MLFQTGQYIFKGWMKDLNQVKTQGFWTFQLVKLPISALNRALDESPIVEWTNPATHSCKAFDSGLTKAELLPALSSVW